MFADIVHDNNGVLIGIGTTIALLAAPTAALADQWVCWLRPPAHQAVAQCVSLQEVDAYGEVDDLTWLVRAGLLGRDGRTLGRFFAASPRSYAERLWEVPFFSPPGDDEAALDLLHAVMCRGDSDCRVSWQPG